MSGKKISIEEWELTSLFASEPHKLDVDCSWFYNTLTYIFRSGCWHVEFTVSPSYKTTSFVVRNEGRTCFEFARMEIDDIRFLTDPEGLAIALLDGPVLSLYLEPLPFVRFGVDQ